MLMPSPPVVIDTSGPVGQAIAEALPELLGAQHDASAPGGVRPSLVLVEPGDSGLTDLADRLMAAASQRGHRVWVVLCDPTQVVAADTIIDDIEVADALLLIDAAHPARAAAALAGWIWLRHDAPSLALGTLRDSSGHVCRIATLTAATPAQPPAEPSEHPKGSGPSADRARSVWQAGLATASSAGERSAVQVLDENSVPLAEAVAALTMNAQEDGEACAEQFLADVRHWHPAELTHLQRVADEDSVATAESTATAQTRAVTAAMAVAEARAAMAQESSRAGFASRFGRRKRLAELQTAADEAQDAWSIAATGQGKAAAIGAFAAVVTAALPTEVAQAEVRSSQDATTRAQTAVEQWLARTAEAAAQLTPTAAPAGVTVARSWGDAQPQVRRHLLVPARVGTAGLDQQTAAVTVHPAEGLPRPLAVAWLLGLSASSFGAESGTGSGPGFEHAQSSSETQH